MIESIEFLMAAWLVILLAWVIAIKYHNKYLPRHGINATKFKGNLFLFSRENEIYIPLLNFNCQLYSLGAVMYTLYQSLGAVESC